MNRALVLSGGGTSGVAWQTGLLKGLHDAGVDLTNLELFVGTSAGAIVGAQLATGHNVTQLYNHQVEVVGTHTSRDVSALKRATSDLRNSLRANNAAEMTPEMLVALGAMALRANTESEEDRLATIRSYFGQVVGWPETALLITSIDIETGELVVWDKHSGVSLIKAVASSCAAPMIVPPTTINGRRYMDAGLRSGTNAQLASGYDLIVVLAVAQPGPLGPLSNEISRLQESGSHVEAVLPGEAACKAIFPNPLDLTKRAASAKAGFEQGFGLASVASKWML